jgi:hypothetical protein
VPSMHSAASERFFESETIELLSAIASRQHFASAGDSAATRHHARVRRRGPAARRVCVYARRPPAAHVRWAAPAGRRAAFISVSFKVHFTRVRGCRRPGAVNARASHGLMLWV